MRRVFLTAVLSLVGIGCGVSVEPTATPVHMTGNVTLGGKPATDIAFNFQPTGAGLPAVVQVKDGKFEADVIPGKYTYFVSKASTPTGEKSLAAVPKAFLEGSMDRQIEVTAAGPLEITIQ